MIFKKNNKPGYILAFTLAMIALFMFLAAYVTNKGLIFGSFSKTMVDREKARQLAYGGIQLAMSQLSFVESLPKEEMAKEKQAAGKDTKNKEQPHSDGKQLLKTILPIFNKVQKYELKQALEGVNGTITITLGSEEGKININRLYDFEKHKFVGEGQAQGDMKKMFHELFGLIKEQINADLFGEFEKFLKERKYPLNDVTELLTIKGFDIFKHDTFVDSDQKKPKIYLTDIFTTASSKQTIEPWLLSDSLITLLKLKKDKEKLPPMNDVLKSFKDKSDWKNDWGKSLKLLYNQDYTALPKTIAPLLNPTFDPKMFSVISSGIVGKATVKLLAFLERDKGSGKDANPIVHIRRIYLL